MPEPKQPDLPPDVRDLSFEAAMAELEGIVSKLESGKVGLEQSIEIYTRGTQLRTHCEAKLQAAKAQVERLVVGTNGEVTGSQPMDPD
jgi:exodeoxyribonuclease VII small subunit